MKKPIQTGKYISALYRLTLTYMSDRLEKYNLSNIEYAYLMVLHEEDNLTQDELTKKLFVDKSQTTRAVKLLIEKGFVKKCRNQNDGRSFIVSLTESGKELAPQIYGEILDFEEKLNEGIPYERQREIKKDLIKMMRNLKEE